MEHEANGLVLIFLGEALACRQDGLCACSAAAFDRLSISRDGSVVSVGSGSVDN